MHFLIGERLFRKASWIFNQKPGWVSMRWLGWYLCHSRIYSGTNCRSYVYGDFNFATQYDILKENTRQGEYPRFGVSLRPCLVAFAIAVRQICWFSGNCVPGRQHARKSSKFAAPMMHQIMQALRGSDSWWHRANSFPPRASQFSASWICIFYAEIGFWLWSGANFGFR